MVDPHRAPPPPSLKARCHRTLASVALVCASAAAVAQPSAVGGSVVDAVTSEVLPGASVYAPALGVGTTTNAYGHFSLGLPAGVDSLALSIRYLGYVPGSLTVASSDPAPIVVRLVPGVDSLGGVAIEAARSDAASDGIRLSAREVSRVPALLGEADVMKVVQLLPGVAQGAEGTTGLHVRGGSPDQTLLLLDGATVYNAAHLFGAVSIFNPDVVQSVRLATNGLSAKEGGRLGSVLEVVTRDGRRDRVGGVGSVGVLASRATIEGPLAGGRGAFLVAGRRTYADLFTRLFLDRDEEGYRASAGYAFWDGTAKASYDLDSQTRLFASAYAGRDHLYGRAREAFGEDEETDQDDLAWGNLTGTVRATRRFGPRMFASAVAAYSRYGFDVARVRTASFGDDDRLYRFEQGSGLTDWSVRADAEWAPHPDHSVGFGGGVSFKSYQPVRLIRESRGVGAPLFAEADARAETVTSSVYVEDEVRLARSVRVAVGLRLDVHGVDGVVFLGPQPRLRITAPLGGSWTVTSSVERHWQPLHLLSNAGIGLPTDLWVPATASLPPASGTQYSVGVLWRRPGGEVTVGAYAREMDGLVEYRNPGGSLPSGAAWEEAVTTGGGTAYGVEISARRTVGRLEGWATYSLSRSMRSFPEIEAGRPFPYRYDRTHNANVTLSYALSAHQRFGATWVAATGLAATFPIGRYLSADQFQYGPRNGGRFPTYHRLDVSYARDIGRGTLSVGAYNVYNRQNPFALSLTVAEVATVPGETDYVRQIKSTSLFPILPHVSYQRAF
ncbi:TonB-dependent receptor [Rubrivirga sp.]|uniref:TonB-dependent receptor n=1 Tax=Rubrivirga sp. TaxID=1885344 RepID=UPI003B52670C